jgi:hypothetical protein
MPDSDLSKTNDEIKALLESRDQAGICFFASPTHAEFLMCVSPSWTCIKLESNLPGGGYRLLVRSKAADYASKEEHTKVLSQTIGMLCGMVDLLNNMSDQLGGILEVIGGKVRFVNKTKFEGGR